MFIFVRVNVVLYQRTSTHALNLQVDCILTNLAGVSENFKYMLPISPLENLNSMSTKPFTSQFSIFALATFIT